MLNNTLPVVNGLIEYKGYKIDLELLNDLIDRAIKNHGYGVNCRGNLIAFRPQPPMRPK